MEDRLMRLDEVAEYLRLAKITVYKMAQQGRIPASR
jgi:excisionase family DNA binding protein